MEEPQWQFITSDNEPVFFKQEFVNFANILYEKEITEPLQVAVNSQTLKLVKQFIEIHQYDSTSIKYRKPVASNKPQENLDPLSYKVLNLPDNQQLFDDVLKASYYLDFKLLKSACLVILASQVYIGDDDNDLEQAKQRYGIGDMSPQQELQIMQENGRVFEELNKAFQQLILQEEQKLMQVVSQQQQQQQQQ